MLTQTFIKLIEVCRLQNSNGSLPNRDKIRKILTIHLHKYVKFTFDFAKGVQERQYITFVFDSFISEEHAKDSSTFQHPRAKSRFQFFIRKKVTRMRWA